MRNDLVKQNYIIIERLLLLKLSVELTNAKNENEAAHILGNGLASLIEFDSMAIYHADHETQLLTPIVIKGDPLEEHTKENFFIPFQTDIIGHVMTTLKGELINNAHLDRSSIYFNNSNSKELHIIAIPLAVDKRSWGVFTLNRLGTKLFTQFEFETAQFIAIYASYILTNLKLLRTHSETKALKQLVFDTISDAIITLNDKGIIIFCNESTEKIFGFSESELLNSPIARIIPQSMRDKHETSFAGYTQSGTRKLSSWTSIELEGLCKNGTIKPIEISFGETTEGGRKIFSAVIRDITYRKRAAEILESKIMEATKEIATQNQELVMQAEKILAQHNQLEIQNKRLEEIQSVIQNQKLELENIVYNRTKELQITNEKLKIQYEQLEQYSFIIAHNLRGPVARILGLTSIIDKHSITEYNKETLERLTESTKDLDTIVKDLGYILDLRNNVNSIIYDEIELNPLIEKILTRLNEEIIQTSAKIELCIATAKVNAPRVYIDSILYNLISNSLKFRDPYRELVISISILQKDYVNYLTISDNGIGFPTGISHKLFKPFQQFNLNGRLKGRGLGLYLTKRHVEAMKGRIKLSSRENLGSVFRIQWPDAKPNEVRQNQ